MVFDESPLKDIYRRVTWGPYRRGLGRLPAGTELRANRRLGQLAWVGSRGKRARVHANMRRAFGDTPELDRWVRQTFETHFVDQYISWLFARMVAGEWELELKGRDLLDAALASGQGAVLVHPHMGPAQLPLCQLGVWGYPTHQIGGGGVAHTLSAEGERVTRLRHELEQVMPVTLWDGARALRPVVRALQANSVVLTALDGTGGGVELGRRLERTVLGQTMRVPVGGAYLSWKTGAALLGLVTHREHGRWVSSLQRLETPSGKRTRALEQGADQTAAFLEACLRRWPGDWHFWDEFEPGRFLV
jgi:lauroyl/myristoyl acyltransferase